MSTVRKVAMVAPPWLALPIKGYGGIERVIEGIIDGLRAKDIHVELFANTARRPRGVPTHGIYKEELFEYIDLPYYDAPLQIMQAHLHYALQYIEKHGDFDIIHDHNPYIGPSFFSLASRIDGIPPVLHTFHGPPFSRHAGFNGEQMDNTLQLRQMNPGRQFTVCISKAMAKSAPSCIKQHMLQPVHNAVDVQQFPFEKEKQDYYITLARFTRDKGQKIAVDFAAKYKKRLRMAGTVAGMGTNRRVLMELSNPMSKYRNNEEFRYFSDEILPKLLLESRITYAGNVSGLTKNRFVSNAKALLFPIQWDEPFGMAVIEALASGTPVVAMKRGSMPEIIQHGVNGFLAKDEKEFAEYALRVDEIDPRACRASVEQNFSIEKMASEYIVRYEEILNR